VLEACSSHSQRNAGYAKTDQEGISSGYFSTMSANTLQKPLPLIKVGALIACSIVFDT
jgi:hypothetical protein